MAAPADGAAKDVDTSEFDTAKKVRGMAGKLEAVLDAALKSKSTAQERTIWETVEAMMEPALRLVACGYLEVVLMGVLHILHSRDAEQQPVGVVSLPAHGQIRTPADILFAERAAPAPAAPPSAPRRPRSPRAMSDEAVSMSRALTEAEAAAVAESAAPPAGYGDAVRLAHRWLSPTEKDAVRRFLAELIETCHPSYTIPALLALKSPYQKPFEGMVPYGLQVSELLDRAVLRPGGVLALSQALLTDLKAEQADGFRRVASAVVKTPRFLHSAEEHLRLVAPQLRALWMDAKAWQSPCLAEFVPLALTEFYRKAPRLARKHLFRPTMRALYCMTDAAARAGMELPAQPADSDGAGGEDRFNIVCDGAETVGAIDCLHRMLFAVKRKVGFAMFGGLLPALLKLHATLYKSPLQARHAVEECITQLLKCDEAKARLALLTHVAYTTGLGEAAVAFKGLPSLDLARGGVAEEGYYYTPSVVGGVELRYGALPPRDELAALTHLLDVLATKHHSEVPGDLLADLLEELMARDEVDAQQRQGGPSDAAAPTPSTTPAPATTSATPLLDLPGGDARAAEELEARQNVTRLALAVIEKIGAVCLKNGAQALTIITYLVTLAPVQAGRPAAEIGEEEREEQTGAATTGLTLLQLALTDKIVVAAAPEKLRRLQKALKGVVSDDSEIREILAAVTLGVDRLVAKQHTGGDAATAAAATPGEEECSETVLQGIFADLMSHNVAMIGHGLIAMKRFVSAPQHGASLDSNFDAIFETFVAHAADEESFLFISAGNGLIALCDARPERTLTALLARYRPAKDAAEGAARARPRPRETLRQHRRREGNRDETGEGKFSFKPDEPIPLGKKPKPAAKTAPRPPKPAPSLKQTRDHRLADAAKEEARVVKLADVLTYCVWRTGTSMRAAVADVYLERCHYKQTEVVRASALQALSSLALHSPWSIYAGVDRVLQTAYDVLAMDKAVLCQRAAASFIYHLFCGMRNDAVVHLEAQLPRMLDVARRRLRDEDPVVAEYFRLFLEEGNALRLEMHGAPQHSLFSKPNNAF
eukprot:TRINITY_DN29797_c0_g1_i1.p1 TRINITY_DN29797_c0_g1~~TRINITY_DN29797_c0_g1_i1.p1  ORF type:complete len:1051 (+),score=412.62 TRINITY_DN29797_c0_g1_i1:95-3247(+)